MLSSPPLSSLPIAVFIYIHCLPFFTFFPCSFALFSSFISICWLINVLPSRVPRCVYATCSPKCLLRDFQLTHSGGATSSFCGGVKCFPLMLTHTHTPCCCSFIVVLFAVVTFFCLCWLCLRFCQTFAHFIVKLQGIFGAYRLARELRNCTCFTKYIFKFL